MVPNSMLLRCDGTIPSKYHLLATKVSETTKFFKSVVPSHPIKELLQTSSLQADEQEAKVQEMMNKSDKGEIENSALLLTMSSFQQQCNKVVQELSLVTCLLQRKHNKINSVLSMCNKN